MLRAGLLHLEGEEGNSPWEGGGLQDRGRRHGVHPNFCEAAKRPPALGIILGGHLYIIILSGSR